MDGEGVGVEAEDGHADANGNQQDAATQRFEAQPDATERDAALHFSQTCPTEEKRKENSTGITSETSIYLNINTIINRTLFLLHACSQNKHFNTLNNNTVTNYLKHSEFSKRKLRNTL